MPSYRSEEFDPITALFEDAEALHNLSSLLSEDRAGFACLLVLLADDVKRCAEALEAEEKKKGQGLRQQDALRFPDAFGSSPPFLQEMPQSERGASAWER